MDHFIFLIIHANKTNFLTFIIHGRYNQSDLELKLIRRSILFDTNQYHIHYLTPSDVEVAGDFISLQLYKRVFLQRSVKSKHAG